MDKNEADIQSLNARYERQARWFYGVRSQLLCKAGIRNCRAVLDLGCGTGVVTRELRRRCRGRVCASNVNAEAFAVAPANFEGVETAVCRDGALQYAEGAFDLVFTQMFFLWVRDVPAMLAEIHRVLERGAQLVVAAEPDYGGRIEHPQAFRLRDALIGGLRAAGADPFVSRKLRGLLLNAGFEVESGVHASLFDRERLAESLDDEYTLARELGKQVAMPSSLKDDPSLFLFMPYFHFLCRKL